VEEAWLVLGGRSSCHLVVLTGVMGAREEIFTWQPIVIWKALHLLSTTAFSRQGMVDLAERTGCMAQTPMTS